MHTRRNILAFIGGSAAGAVLTPVPWRLVTDAALWSQNWPGIPKPARGPIQFKYTNCSLCPAGCAVKARCVGQQPVSLAGAGNPLSHGALCPFGLAGHHLPYHPDRLKQGAEPEAAAAVASAIASCGPRERVAVLDLRPGRTASWTYRRAMAAIPNGVYIACGSTDYALDLSKARTVLSFGAPVLDGWGTPGNVLSARAGFRLIQAETVQSRSAALADEWLAIKPGSEIALAKGLAAALAGDKGLPPAMADWAKDFTPAKAAAATGLTEQRIAGLAQELVNNGPALVIPGETAPEAFALNQLIGAFGSTVTARAEAPVPDSWRKAAPVTHLAGVADGSIRVLLIDESVPGEYVAWREIEKKLAPDNAVVAVFAWSRAGYGRHARFTLPTAVYPEAAEDIPGAVDCPAPAFRISAPLIEAPSGMVSPAAFIAKLAGIDASGALRERADAIQKAGRGTLLAYADGSSKPVKETTPDDFWKALNEGGCWMDAETKPVAPAPIDLAGAQGESRDAGSLPLVVALADTGSASRLVSPVMSKLYRESNLRLGSNRATLHPGSASEFGVVEGGRALFETAEGKCEIEILVDTSVPPGVVEIAAGPEVIDLCGAHARARVTPL